MRVLRIIIIFNFWCAVAVQSNRTIYFLPNFNQLGFWHSTVGTFVTDNSVWISQRFRLTYGQSPGRWVRYKQVLVHGSEYHWKTITLEKRTGSNRTIRRFRVRKSICSKNWACGCQRSIVVIGFLGNRICAKCSTVGFLNHLPIILLNFWTGCILAFDTNDLSESSIYILLRLNFASRIDDKVTSKVCWTTSLN